MLCISPTSRWNFQESAERYPYRAINAAKGRCVAITQTLVSDARAPASRVHTLLSARNEDRSVAGALSWSSCEHKAMRKHQCMEMHRRPQLSRHLCLHRRRSHSMVYCHPRARIGAHQVMVSATTTSPSTTSPRMCCLRIGRCRNSASRGHNYLVPAN